MAWRLVSRLSTEPIIPEKWSTGKDAAGQLSSRLLHARQLEHEKQERDKRHEMAPTMP